MVVLVRQSRRGQVSHGAGELAAPDEAQKYDLHVRQEQLSSLFPRGISRWLSERAGLLDVQKEFQAIDGLLRGKEMPAWV